MRLRGLRTVAYFAEDVGACRDWYTRLLGHGPYFDEPFYVGFDVGGYELGIQPANETRGPGAGGQIALWGVGDVPAALETLVEMGATVHEAAREVGGGIVTGSVTDPFGNQLGLIFNPHFAPPMTAAAVGDVSDRALVKEAVVPISVADAWALWTSSEGFAKWWVPGARVDLRPGGLLGLYFMTDAPPGLQGSETCRFLSFVPGRMVSFTWNSPPMLATRERHTWVVIDFDELADGTRVRLTHLGWPESEWSEAALQWPETFEYFDAAWGRVMELFAAHCAESV